MSNITEHAQQLTTEALVELFQLDCQAIGAGVYHFTSDTAGGPTTQSKLKFDGVTYEPLPIEADGFEWSGEGAMPTPTLRLSNVNLVLEGIVQANHGLIGCTLTRIRTFRHFLDDGDNPDPNAIFSKDIYRVERLSRRNKVFMEFELAAVVDQEGTLLPRRLAVRDYCSHTYRRYDGNSGSFDYSGVTCPYTGQEGQSDGRYFDVQGNEVADPAKDQCSKLLGTGCQRRFKHPSGDAAQAREWGRMPFRGFPGLAQRRNR
jgi:lambda family phage minor tail protein L